MTITLDEIKALHVELVTANKRLAEADAELETIEEQLEEIRSLSRRKKIDALEATLLIGALQPQYILAQLRQSERLGIQMDAEAKYRQAHLELKPQVITYSTRGRWQGVVKIDGASFTRHLDGVFGRALFGNLTVRYGATS